jgi:hypothetical protein
MRYGRWLQMAAVAAGLTIGIGLFMHTGVTPVLAALRKIHWWQFGLICLAYPLVLAADSAGWSFSFPRGAAPFGRLLLARAAGEAVNAASVLGPVGGEPLRAWLVRPWVPYEESVPSLIVAKTANVAAQAVFVALALVLATAVLRLDGRLDGRVLLGLCALLAIEIVALAGFVVGQLRGGVSWLGRILDRLGVRGGSRSARHMDRVLGDYYRENRGRFAAALGCHLAGRLLGAVEVGVILWALHHTVPAITALAIEAVGSGVRFAVFFLPGGLGVLEGANTATFGALGLGASLGLAFSVLRRARQLVWMALGLAAIGAARLGVSRRAARGRGRAGSPGSAPRRRATS